MRTVVETIDNNSSVRLVDDMKDGHELLSPSDHMPFDKC